MDDERYTPGHVWKLLVGEIETDEVDLDEMLDLGVGLSRLPDHERTFLTLLYQGYPASTAMKEAGVTGNQTRYLARTLIELTREMNGDGDDATERNAA